MANSRKSSRVSPLAAGTVKERLTKISDLAVTLLQEADELRLRRFVEASGLMELFSPSSGPTYKEKVRRFEKLLISQALNLAQGQQAQAARLLGLNPSTLHKKIREYKLM